MFDYTTARQQMIDCQIRTADVTDYEVLRAFRKVSREKFVPKAQKALAYADTHIELDDNRVLIRPRDFAKMVHSADIKPTDIVLDIACGRAYSTAILAHLAETVIGLENNEERITRATNDLTDADISNVAIVQGNLEQGAAEHGPFDVIFVNGAVGQVPQAWFDQLADKGRLVVVVQDGPVGRACVYTKADDTVGERVVFDTSLLMLDGFQREAVFAL